MNADACGAVGPHHVGASASARSDAFNHDFSLTLDEAIENHLAATFALRVGALALRLRLARAAAKVDRLVRRFVDPTRDRRRKYESTTAEEEQQRDAPSES
jgi:hypothetical protein